MSSHLVQSKNQLFQNLNFTQSVKPMSYNAIIHCLALPLPSLLIPSFLRSTAYKALTSHSSMHNYSLLPKYSLCVSLALNVFFFFSDNHASLHFHSVNSYASFKTQLAHYFLHDISLMVPSKTGQSLCSYTLQRPLLYHLTHWIVLINFTCLSLPFEIALSSSLPSHIKANKQKPVSPLSGNFT